MPPGTEHHCVDAANWVETKSRWGLSVTAAEATTLKQILTECKPSNPPTLIFSQLQLISTMIPATPISVETLPVAVAGVTGRQLRRCEKREERVTSANAGLEPIPLDQFGSLAPGSDAGRSDWRGSNCIGWRSGLEAAERWNNDGDIAFLVSPSGSEIRATC
jgi:hypothetical protein